MKFFYIYYKDGKFLIKYVIDTPLAKSEIIKVNKSGNNAIVYDTLL